MATRIQLYKLQSQIRSEVLAILEKAEKKAVRKVALDNTIKDLDNKLKEFQLNHEKLLQHGVTEEMYFKDHIFETTKEMVEKTKGLLEIQKLEPEEKVPEIVVGTKKDNQQDKDQPDMKQMIVKMQQQQQQQMQFLQQQMQQQQQQQMEMLQQQMEQQYKQMMEQMEAKIHQEPDKQKIHQHDPQDNKNKICEDQATGKSSAKSNAMLIHFRKQIYNLEDNLKEEQETSSLYLLENLKKSWQKQMDYIKTLHWDLSVNCLIQDDIDDELCVIEKTFNIHLKDLLRKISNFGEEKKPIALKNINIPCFNGNVEEWNSFHDLFKKIVDGNTHLGDCEKLYHLKTNLRGEALKLIQHLSITDSNYEAAWDILIQRYGNRRILFTKLVDTILDQPHANSTSASSIKTLLDTTNESIQALKAMEVKLEDADPIIARIIIRKLDKDGLMLYEQNTKKSKEIQELKDVMEFLEQHYQALEASTIKKYNSNQKQQFRSSSFLNQKLQKLCRYCKKVGHETCICNKFLALPIEERHSWVKKSEICYKCLNHKRNQKCVSDSKCQQCGMFHHTLIHLVKQREKASSMNSNSSENVLLATAQIKVKSLHGELITLRALIDQGSQITTISEEAAQMLQLPRAKTNMKIHGLGNTVVGVAKSKVNIEIRPRFLSDDKIVTEALILPALASAQPDTSFQYDVEKWHNFNLADPNFNKSGRIDLLIGADLFIHIIDEGIHRKGNILGQNTKLGWILSGVLCINQPRNKRTSAMTTGIERFWEIEEIDEEYNASENELCLAQYEKTTKLGEDGRFIVRLPFTEDRKLGESRKRAMARFLSLEKRFSSDLSLKTEYSKIIDELISMGHMKKVDQKQQGKYYLPHQAVVRESSITTKIRVVFDASSKTTNGRSLNDILHIGPKLQKDIFEIISRWRTWKYVISADVEKMFRQININEEDQEYQYILWRNRRTDPIEQYKLTTVTYGTASAPFLAIRTLQEIGNKCKREDIAQKIREDFYMDDLLTGADTLQQCKEVQMAITEQLSKFGFHLRKWISNEEQIIRTIKSADKNEVLNIQEDECIKTLGLQWNPANDCFTFKMQMIEDKPITKRIALSHLARIFDPLGWLTPVTVTAKLFIQHLWKLQSDWDEPLDENLTKEWRNFTQHLSSLTSVKINRWLNTKQTAIQLHGFADASGKAYAAVVYVKNGSKITIVAAKSKVNPIKNRKTLPKLELCAAHLLAKLLHKIKTVFEYNTTTYAWSDSMITLSWIQSSKNKDKFIRSKVDEINSLVPTAKWGYIKSKENPADMGSRGIPPEKLVQDNLWWYGPLWLQKNEVEWSSEQPKEVFVAATKSTQLPNDIYEVTVRYSSFRKMKRVIAYVLRFINKIKGSKNYPAYLSTKELQAAEAAIIRIHQEAEYPDELRSLKNGSVVDHRSKLASLNPILDENEIMRVGGRLEYSNLAYNKKHPIIIQKSALADSIINEVHEKTLHGGNRLMENTIKKNYWILGVKNSIKKCIRSCIRCTRYKQETQHQLMGILPKCRVHISSPFTHCGIDYAGPIQVKCSNGRGQKAYKGYVAVFICMTTKAVHLEAVSSLTTEAFLGALKRFFARRGKSSHLYSDNGTNFVGAAKKLDKDFIAAIKNNSNIAPILEEEKICWHFIPPASPHFGGIWEAAVKSMKHHLKRIIGENKLTYEELSTLLSQIEAVLNSRPLHILHSSPEEIDALTPGHFLIGRPMIECPEENRISKITCLDRWKLLQKLKTHFWNQWKADYLSSLQQRLKWKAKTNNLQIGQVVIIKNEDTHPARWPLGRVAEVHPGKDGMVRVVTLKTENGILKRPIHKLCPLEHHATEDKNNDTQEGKLPRNVPSSNTSFNRLEM